MLCLQGDRRGTWRQQPGCYGQLRASFARGRRESGAGAACYDALRPFFVGAEFRRAGSKPLRLRHLERDIPSRHSVKGRSQSVLSRSQKAKTEQGRKQGARERPLPRKFWPRNRRKPLTAKSLRENGPSGKGRSASVLSRGQRPKTGQGMKQGARERPLLRGDSPRYRRKSLTVRSLREDGFSRNRALQRPFGCASHLHFYVLRLKHKVPRDSATELIDSGNSNNSRT